MEISQRIVEINQIVENNSYRFNYNVKTGPTHEILGLCSLSGK